MASDVSTRSEESKRHVALAALPRTLMGGTKAMRTAAVLYLPQEKAESAEAYQSRLKRSFLFNAFRKTVKDMTGKVFAKAVVLDEDVPAQIVDWAENADLAGRHLNVFARDVFFDAMQTGIGYILTDMPAPLAQGTGRNGEVTKADEQTTGRRPYLCYIKSEDLIGWKVKNINGVPTLVQVRIREDYSEPDGLYGETCGEQIRVLTPGAWEIWRKAGDQGKEQWTLYQSGTTSLAKITLAPVYINRTGFMCGEPPLEDLADLNVAHWQSQSDQRNILHVARVPILFMAGWKEDDAVEIGSSRACRTDNADAKMEFVEHNGNAIDSGDKDLTNLEQQMQTQGLQLLMPIPGGKTATGALLDDSKENSPLAMMAGALQDALEQSFGFMAEYGGLGTEGGSCKVNDEFGLSNLDVPQIIAAYAAGLLDAQTAVEELKRRNFIDDSVDPELVMQRLKDQATLDAKNAMDFSSPPGGGNLNGPAANPPQ